MSGYTPTIGLEIHAELKTQTKMFCNSKNDPDEKRPNVNICPVCMGYPGTLPTINRKAVEHVLRVGVAVGGTIADYSEFDRKNYFYPDIPKGYQISQYAYPLVRGGELAGVRLTRIHLEEDTARSQHITSQHQIGDNRNIKVDKVTGDVTGIEFSKPEEYSLIDFNRAGVPLMELVTEPVIHDAETAGRFAKELQLLLRTLGVSDADMEKGHLRVEVNISLREIAEERGSDADQHGNDTASASDPHSSATLGTKVEIKNINSFRAAMKAIEHEAKRQSELLESGGTVVQETRGWDDAKGETFSQRAKESSHDYRYFPDPDLPKMKISDIPEWSEQRLRDSLPELPWEKRERFAAFGINKDQVELFVSDFAVGSFFDAVAQEVGNDVALVKTAANYIAADLVGLTPDFAENKVTPASFAELVRLVADGTVSSRGAKDVLAHMVKEGGDAKAIAQQLGVVQQHDEGALLAVVKQVIDENPNVVAEYKGGKETSLQFLVGQGMKLSKGSANPKVLAELLQKTLA